MFFMASTDLDKFRDFVFNSSFLNTYEVDEATLEEIKSDDVALMKFSFKYLASSLFGTNNLKIKEEKLQAKVEELKKSQDEAEKRAEETYHGLLQDREMLQKEIAARKK
jgi:hypothetical protein